MRNRLPDDKTVMSNIQDVLSYLGNTDLYSSFISCFGDGEQLPVPTGFSDSDFQQYLAYIRRKQNPVTTMVKQLKMCHLIGDNNYLKYLIGVMLSEWSSTYKHVLSELHDTLLEIIYMYLPYHLLPETVNLNYKFVNKWAIAIGNKQITVDGIVYSHDINFYQNFTADDNNNTNNVVNNNTNELNEIVCKASDMKHGKWLIWYLGGNLKLSSNFEFGVETGLVIKYYDNGNKEEQHHIVKVDGYKQYYGDSWTWYPSGQLATEYKREGTKQHGVTTFWKPDGTVSYTQNWSHGVNNSLYTIDCTNNFIYPAIINTSYLNTNITYPSTTIPMNGGIVFNMNGDNNYNVVVGNIV